MKIKGKLVYVLIPIIGILIVLFTCNVVPSIIEVGKGIFQSGNKINGGSNTLNNAEDIYPDVKDSDNDGITDDMENELNTNIFNSDTDGDGLLDGKAQYMNNEKIAPIDPEPLIPNGPKGIWQKQILLEKSQSIPYYLTDFYEYNFNYRTLSKTIYIDWQKLKASDDLFNDVLKLPILKELSSKILTFRLDNGGKILHSQTNEDIYEYILDEAKEKLSSSQYKTFKSAIDYLDVQGQLETWQKKFGFNKLYDEVFKIATNNNMRSDQIFFNDKDGSKYVLWIWRGDYLVLGSGAEMGLYKENILSGAGEIDIEHWDAVKFEVPMTLNLYNYYGENNIEHIFSWKPTNKQWWITGFNPDYSDVDVTKQVMIGTVDFSEHKDMYNSIKEQIVINDMKNYMIFDDIDSTIWIYWYEI